MDFSFYDFHMHTFLSDGTMLPMELIRFAAVSGRRVMAVTDHVSASNMERIIREVKADTVLAGKYWGITVIAGVELTNIPAGAVAPLAAKARALGAELVVVHGETLVEPVDPGTNLAAVSCPDVDILAHPGLIALEEARLAKENGVCLEISLRRGHAFANGHVVNMARKAGAKILLNSDAHTPNDLVRQELAVRIGRGAGLTAEEIALTSETAREITEKILARREETG
ncbi:MAG: histidinol phosphate phosphatase domain-containing protein [Firmicutes bacterium]|nr:histidinol phosphate phosphatase domain-containing protein [Bacillota bacterium]